MRILVTGAGGQVGSEIVAELQRREAERKHGHRWRIFPATRSDIDLASRDSVLAAITQAEPDVVFHAGALTSVDHAETHPTEAFKVNTLGTRYVAEAARITGAHVCYLSTDYVFDGTLEPTEERPGYMEWDEPNPLSHYGRSKLGGERELEAHHTVVRTAWVCGRIGSNMAKTVLRLAKAPGRQQLSFVDDQLGSPTMAADLARKVVDLGLARRRGTFHVTNQGSTTWFGFAQEVLRLAGEDPDRVQPIKTAELNPQRAAPRPACSVLDNAVLRLSGEDLLPEWRESLAGLVPSLPADA